MTRKFCSMLVASLLLSTPQLLLAQSGLSDDAIVQSRLHFDRGVVLYKEGSLDAALGEFSRAYDLNHDYRLLYNIAQVQAERHDYARAIGVLGDYLKQGGGAIPKERRLEVDSEMTRLRQRVAELWVSANSPGAEVWIGSRVAAKLPLSAPILVNAGPCTVRVTSPGHKTIVRELQLAGGDRPRLELELELEPERDRESMPSNAAPPMDRPVRNNTWLGVSLAATGALAAGSVVFGVLANKANTTLDTRLNTYPSNPASIDGARATVRTDALVCDVLAGAAVVAAGASLYFYLNPKYEYPTKPGNVSKGPSAQLVPTPTGLWLNGKF